MTRYCTNQVLLISLLSLVNLSCGQADRTQRIQHSQQWNDGVFENPEPMKNDLWGSVVSMFDSDPHTSPTDSLPVTKVDPALFKTQPGTGLRVTWLGHSSFILEQDGHRFLVDPVWALRSSPSQWLGPKRWYHPPIALSQLPELDAVLISHNHFDHFDPEVIKTLTAKKLRFVVPLGLGEALEGLGVQSDRITELDWWETTQFGNLKITSTPARHTSGRGLFDQAKTLWMGFALQGLKHNVYYSGDTGPFKSAPEIGKRLGPFDLTLIECGQYNQAWPDWHLTPEKTLATHQAVRGRVLIPVHWGLFPLASHSWKEPVERLLVANTDGAAKILVPKPGQSIEPESQSKLPEWWKDLE